MLYLNHKTIYILNDTSDYHGGSWAVMQYLTDLFSTKLYEILKEEKKSEIEIEKIQQADIILLNGEGTLHSSKPRAIHLLKALEYAQKLGKPTILCNTSWFNMTNEFDHVLKNLTQLVVREKLSFDELETKHNITPEIALDLSFHYPFHLISNERSIRFLATDFYSKEFNCFVFPNGGTLEKIPSFNMRSASWKETLDKFSSSRVIITGRFHGFIACLKTQTRFIAYPGNTPKIDGVLEWFGNDTALVKDYKYLLTNTKKSHQNLNYYNDLFDWTNNMIPWKPYFLK
ncbi:MAG TPA: polysaccharide pyruvyl transferase family protein [Arcobacter sp.]|nr:polysaccharide pyruvyl transferase family protein [Arcobacter sp.]